MKAFEIINELETWVPIELIDSWDNTGLQVGNPELEIDGVLIAMDVTDNVIDKAIKEGFNMIVTHHPFIFKPLENLVFNNYKSTLIKKIIKNDIIIYNAHTNLDLAHGGINDELARLFKMQNTTYLNESKFQELVKLVIYVPQTHQQEMLEVISKAGAGYIGNYSNSSFAVKGTGRFKPLEGNNPFMGTTGKSEEVHELRIETVVKKNNLEKTIQLVKESHPYEEVALDILPMLNKGETYGYGRVGNIEKSSLQSLAELTKQVLELDQLRVYGNTVEEISRIAVCGGAGADFIKDAKRHNAQVYITGDIKYHDAQLAYEEGMVLIDGTHYGTEKIILPVIEKKLTEYTKGNIKISILNDSSFNYLSY